MNIVLDTNILQKEGLHSANMSLLCRLSRESEVFVYIPEIVKREYLSQIDFKLRSKQTVGNSSELTKFYKDNHSVLKRIARAENYVNALYIRNKEASEIVFKNWLDENSFVVRLIDKNDYKRVLDAYFDGTRGFRSVKHRPDFPDAFIYESINNIKEEEGGVVAVIGDGPFKNLVKERLNVSCFDSLSSLMEEKQIKEKIANLDNSERLFKILCHRLIITKPSAHRVGPQNGSRVAIV
ncbi:MAG: PIN domain-containing protein [Gammaproteobacteria bacterium]|nr:PIN domain-containing protein [Gammaproteobacteria bacterium]